MAGEAPSVTGTCAVTVRIPRAADVHLEGTCRPSRGEVHDLALGKVVLVKPNSEQMEKVFIQDGRAPTAILEIARSLDTPIVYLATLLRMHNLSSNYVAGTLGAFVSSADLRSGAAREHLRMLVTEAEAMEIPITFLVRKAPGEAVHEILLLNATATSSTERNGWAVDSHGTVALHAAEAYTMHISKAQETLADFLINPEQEGEGLFDCLPSAHMGLIGHDFEFIAEVRKYSVAEKCLDAKTLNSSFLATSHASVNVTIAVKKPEHRQGLQVIARLAGRPPVVMSSTRSSPDPEKILELSSALKLLSVPPEEPISSLLVLGASLSQQSTSAHSGPAAIVSRNRLGLHSTVTCT